MNWKTQQLADYLIAVTPIGDTHTHTLEDPNCPCAPKILYENGSKIIVHNAFDGRHLLEQKASMTQ